MENLFLLLGIALIAASVIGYFSRALKQPLILAYIVTGFLLGPAAFNLIEDVEVVRVLSEMGITFLLFTVGLNMSPRNIKDLGKISMVTGIGQVVVTTLLGFLLAVYLGIGTIEALYIGIALAFSSTIIIVKLLMEKNDINSLHGRISVGFLLVQDFLAILALILVTGLGTGNEIWASLSSTFLKAALLITVLVLLTKYLLPSVFGKVAKNQELLFISSISYCFLFAITSYFLNLSIEIGAFLAGVSLASLPYNLHIENKIRPLRDFFIVIFFVTLGAQIGFSMTSDILIPIVLFSLLVLIGNPLILIVIMGLLGYRKRTSFLVGLTVAQISEFSLILVALGLKVGHVSTEIVSIVTAVGVITITVSAYMINYSHKIYHWLEKYLGVFERKRNVELDNIEQHMKDHVVVVGYHRVGFGIVRKLRDSEKNVLVVDFDPEVIKTLMKEGVPCIYGDIADPEILEKMNLKGAEVLLSTAPDVEDNIELMKQAKSINPAIIVMMVSEHVEEALELYEKGADYVILPHMLGGHHASLMLEDMSTNIDKLIETKIDHIEELRQRKDLHPHHSHSSRMK